MNKLISHVVEFFSLAPSLAPTPGVARNLMERAEAGAGRDPRQARELRRAAQAYLSVVR